jgi:NADH:ubiquinone oxidoreductase subunit K
MELAEKILMLIFYAVSAAELVTGIAILVILFIKVAKGR